MLTPINLQIKYEKETQKQPNMIPLEFEGHFQQVIGHYASELPNDIQSLSLSDLKKLYLHYLGYIKRAVQINVSTADRLQIDLLDEIFVCAEDSLKSVKSIEEMQFHMIAVLGQICFTLLGNIPQNTSKGRLSDKDFVLNQYRSICYTQTAVQKANVICDFVCNESTMVDSAKAICVKRYSFKSDAEFIEWFKMNYKELYLKLF